MLISIFIVMCGKTGKGFNYSMQKWLDILKRISFPTIRIVKYWSGCFWEGCIISIIYIVSVTRISFKRSYRIGSAKGSLHLERATCFLSAYSHAHINCFRSVKMKNDTVTFLKLHGYVPSQKMAMGVWSHVNSFKLNVLTIKQDSCIHCDASGPYLYSSKVALLKAYRTFWINNFIPFCF